MQSLTHALFMFPMIVFTAVLALAGGYWLLVLMHLAPLELYEHDSLRDDHMASTLVSLGFVGVPATLALTLLMLIAGALTLALELFVLRWLPLGMLRVPLGVLVLWGTLAAASPLAVAACRVLARGLYRFVPFKRYSLLGTVVEVGEVENVERARARLVDKPSCEVQLHIKPDDTLIPGERRILVKYLKEENAYRSVVENSYMETRYWLKRLHLRHKPAASRHFG